MMGILFFCLKSNDAYANVIGAGGDEPGESDIIESSDGGVINRPGIIISMEAIDNELLASSKEKCAAEGIEQCGVAILSKYLNVIPRAFTSSITSSRSSLVLLGVGGKADLADTYNLNYNGVSTSKGGFATTYAVGGSGKSHHSLTDSLNLLTLES